mgnify:CR=1 FL=1
MTSRESSGITSSDLVVDRQRRIRIAGKHDCLRTLSVKPITKFFNRPLFASGRKAEEFFSSIAQTLSVLLRYRSVDRMPERFRLPCVLIAWLRSRFHW